MQNLFSISTSHDSNPPFPSISQRLTSAFVLRFLLPSLNDVSLFKDSFYKDFHEFLIYFFKTSTTLHKPNNFAETIEHLFTFLDLCCSSTQKTPSQSQVQIFLETPLSFTQTESSVSILSLNDSFCSLIDDERLFADMKRGKDSPGSAGSPPKLVSLTSKGAAITLPAVCTLLDFLSSPQTVQCISDITTSFFTTNDQHTIVETLPRLITAHKHHITSILSSILGFLDSASTKVIVAGHTHARVITSLVTILTTHVHLPSFVMEAVERGLMAVKNPECLRSQFETDILNVEFEISSDPSTSLHLSELLPPFNLLSSVISLLPNKILHAHPTLLIQISRLFTTLNSQVQQLLKTDSSSDSQFLFIWIITQIGEQVALLQNSESIQIPPDSDEQLPSELDSPAFKHDNSSSSSSFDLSTRLRLSAHASVQCLPFALTTLPNQTLMNPQALLQLLLPLFSSILSPFSSEHMHRPFQSQLTIDSALVLITELISSLPLNFIKHSFVCLRNLPRADIDFSELQAASAFCGLLSTIGHVLTTPFRGMVEHLIALFVSLIPNQSTFCGRITTISRFTLISDTITSISDLLSFISSLSPSTNRHLLTDLFSETSFLSLLGQIQRSSQNALLSSSIPSFVKLLKTTASSNDALSSIRTDMKQTVLGSSPIDLFGSYLSYISFAPLLTLSASSDKKFFVQSTATDPSYTWEHPPNTTSSFVPSFFRSEEDQATQSVAVSLINSAPHTAIFSSSKPFIEVFLNTFASHLSSQTSPPDTSTSFSFVLQTLISYAQTLIRNCNTLSPVLNQRGEILVKAYIVHSPLIGTIQAMLHCVNTTSTKDSFSRQHACSVECEMERRVQRENVIDEQNFETTISLCSPPTQLYSIRFDSVTSSPDLASHPILFSATSLALIEEALVDAIENGDSSLFPFVLSTTLTLSDTLALQHLAMKSSSLDTDIAATLPASLGRQFILAACDSLSSATPNILPSLASLLLTFAFSPAILAIDSMFSISSLARHESLTDEAMISTICSSSLSDLISSPLGSILPPHLHLIHSLVKLNHSTTVSPLVPLIVEIALPALLSHPHLIHPFFIPVLKYLAVWGPIPDFDVDRVMLKEKLRRQTQNQDPKTKKVIEMADDTKGLNDTIKTMINKTKSPSHRDSSEMENQRQLTEKDGLTEAQRKRRGLMGAESQNKRKGKDKQAPQPVSADSPKEAPTIDKSGFDIEDKRHEKNVRAGLVETPLPPLEDIDFDPLFSEMSELGEVVEGGQSEQYRLMFSSEYVVQMLAEGRTILECRLAQRRVLSFFTQLSVFSGIEGECICEENDVLLPLVNSECSAFQHEHVLTLTRPQQYELYRKAGVAIIDELMDLAQKPYKTSNSIEGRKADKLTKRARAEDPDYQQELYLPQEEAHRERLLIWQSLCCLSLCTWIDDEATADQHLLRVHEKVASKLGYFILQNNLLTVRNFIELFISNFLLIFPSLSESTLHPLISNPQLKPSAVSTAIRIAVYVLQFSGEGILGSTRLRHSSPPTNTLPFNPTNLILDILPWLSSFNNTIKTYAQVLIQTLVKTKSFSEQSSALPSPIDAILTPFIKFFASNADSVAASTKFGQNVFLRIHPIILTLDTAALLQTGRGNACQSIKLATKDTKIFLRLADETTPATIQAAAQKSQTDSNIFSEDSPIRQTMLSFQRKPTPLSGTSSDLSSDMANKPVRATRPLIVCASFVDKTTNLGGLCRTSEIFGAERLVVDNIQITKDPTFRALCVTSDRWLPISQVAQKDLVTAIQEWKEEGYTVVGLEQTSSSVILTEFKFPEKVVLLLGKEKEGIPVEIINKVDVCVEIPQMGMIRSLNVHVSASIMIWEYAHQRAFDQKRTKPT
ncbi:putative RNA methyltransferase, TrmH family protein, expressed [Blattamonas nauphoetae]|uniref:RNA methyltransferase, TrmH family protein, expressed n=1 Tax=Blattamonas nauphoetae TaxID=2049346 RepID=A0ABQ9YEQ6_9EUKA|nr:putative RNA methyltransferase, TrmH family protein, expressed [Blattamonas nauphoetae]